MTGPADLREQLTGLSDKALIDRCAGLRPGTDTTPAAAAKHALRALARRWLSLRDEIRAHDAVLDPLSQTTFPTLRDRSGIGADTAAEMLIIFGDDPARIRSEAAFAKLLRGQPPARLIGNDQPPPAFTRRASPGQRRALPRRHRPYAVPPADDRLCRPSDRQRTVKRDIIRCLKRYLAREIYHRVMTDHQRSLTPS